MKIVILLFFLFSYHTMAHWQTKKQEQRILAEKIAKKSKSTGQQRCDSRKVMEGYFRPAIATDLFEPLLASAEKIHNSSNYPLSDPEKQVILLGPGFVPSFAINKNAKDAIRSRIEKAMKRFVRSIKIRCYFNNMAPTAEGDFFVGNPRWQPKDVTDPQLKKYFEDIHDRLEEQWEQEIEPNSCHPPFPLPNHMIRAIESLRENRDIKICIVDKGGGLCVVSAEWYHSQVMGHLGNDKNYLWCGTAENFLLQFPPAKIVKDLKSLLIYHNKCWLDESKGTLQNHAAYILQSDPTPTPIRNKQPTAEGEERVVPSLVYCFFYITIKLHKAQPASRPITSNIRFPTYFASKYLHKILLPIVKKLPTYISDSKDLIRILERREKTPGPFCLMSADIEGMYPNIPITVESLQKIVKVIEKYGPAAGFDFKNLTFIYDLLWFVLNNMYVTYRDQVWKQIFGTAMGTPCAVVFACLYAAYVEETTLHRLPTRPLLWRFIDDLLGISETLPTLTGFTDAFNDPTIEPTLRLDATYGDAVNFLDLTITKSAEDGSFIFKSYKKPTKTNQYLLFSSSHPIQVFTGLVKGEISRFRVNNTRDTDYEACRTQLWKDLLERQYPAYFLKSIFSAHKPSRQSLLYPAPLEPTTIAVPPPPPPIAADFSVTCVAGTYVVTFAADTHDDTPTHESSSSSSSRTPTVQNSTTLTSSASVPPIQSTGRTLNSTPMPRKKKVKLQRPLILIVPYGEATKRINWTHVLNPYPNGVYSTFSNILFGNTLTAIPPLKAFSVEKNLKRQLTNIKTSGNPHQAPHREASYKKFLHTLTDERWETEDCYEDTGWLHRTFPGEPEEVLVQIEEEEETDRNLGLEMEEEAIRDEMVASARHAIEASLLEARTRRELVAETPENLDTMSLDDLKEKYEAITRDQIARAALQYAELERLAEEKKIALKLVAKANEAEHLKQEIRLQEGKVKIEHDIADIGDQTEATEKEYARLKGVTDKGIIELDLIAANLIALRGAVKERRNMLIDIEEKLSRLIVLKQDGTTIERPIEIIREFTAPTHAAIEAAEKAISPDNPPPRRASRWDRPQSLAADIHGAGSTPASAPITSADNSTGTGPGSSATTAIDLETPMTDRGDIIERDDDPAMNQDPHQRKQPRRTLGVGGYTPDPEKVRQPYKQPRVVRSEIGRVTHSADHRYQEQGDSDLAHHRSGDYRGTTHYRRHPEDDDIFEQEEMYPHGDAAEQAYLRQREQEEEERRRQGSSSSSSSYPPSSYPSFSSASIRRREDERRDDERRHGSSSRR